MIQSDTSKDLVCIQANDLYFWITARDCALILFKKLDGIEEMKAILKKVQSTEPIGADSDKLITVLRNLVALYQFPGDECICECSHGKADPICNSSGLT